MPDQKVPLAGLPVTPDPFKSHEVPKQAADALLDRIMPTKNEKTIEASGIPALDVALNDPEAANAVKTVAYTFGILGGKAGAAVGFGAGVTLMGIVWAVWPKKGR